MGSSKKHKEKRDRKKHKRDRSRSRERDRDSHKKSHKSSHRRDKRKSPEPGSPESDMQLTKRRRISDDEEILSGNRENSSNKTQPGTILDEEFDVDQLLDSKLSENSEFSSLKRSSKKHKDDLKKRQSIGENEDSLEKFATEQLLEEHGIRDVVKRNQSPPAETSQIPYITDVKIKEEPVDEDRAEGHTEPQLSLSIAETNKLRAKLGLKPLDVGKEKPVRKAEDSKSFMETKLREKLGSKVSGEDIGASGSQSQSISDSGKRSRSDSRPKDLGNESPERSEPQLSLSIEETNKLRAKLGLKPLDVKSQIPGDETEDQEPSKPAEVFVKTENLSEKKKAEDLREKLRVIKEKRAIEEKLRKTKGIADSDSEDESSAAWVLKHQRLMQEKLEAEKRAKLLEEMDEEFGVGALVEEEFDKKKSYTSDQLKGLTVAHDVDSFKEGHQVILTLKDKGVLEEEDDVLENVNIVDSERYAKNIENKKKKPDYMPYEEPEYDEFGILKKKNLLSKYDEEIEGEKKKTFKLGEVSSTRYVSREQELELIRMKLKQQNEMSLEMPEMKPANEYYTTEDMVQFKKPKKKKKLKKVSVLKADDLLAGDTVDDRDLGSRRRGRIRDIDMDDGEQDTKIGIPLIGEDIDTKLDLSNVKIEEDQEKELNSALNKAKKLKERKVMASAPEKVIEILNSVNGSNLDSPKASKNVVNIELNSVAEFCRTLGEIPTYGMSGNREEEADDMMDFDRELDDRQKQEETQNQGAWNEVDVEEKPAEISMRENEPILEEEPDISTGVMGALKLATKKGYLDKEDKKMLSAPRTSNLQAQSYTIEEKFYEDDKFGKRDRYTGPVQEFREKSNYKPDVKLEYIDDNGRLLTAKEAFRYLSHKFHGKGPGKNKVDKRMKKLEQDTRLKQMSSTDTPLNTVKLLQQKQKETQSPYIVLSGGNKTLTQTMISKSKPV
ncbi:U4/U6.U5 tri-snRNP-associated protein 1-like isoform X2 [Argiope bruennichi]|uniref:U4/U6.U5 tri-snRNP-associated protein 1-like isoform X2 n=1 Tax=Argiope bruennichi TaxID=94029 RepID=UPI002493F150|nr:U4/U6.U5 tri-snRNP-associated protein 1-like isoform X2 [Argiope bruennichi]